MRCEHCGRSYTPSRPRPERRLRFCSRQCAAAANRAASKECEECGRWCSACASVDKECGACGATFVVERAYAMSRAYCSTSCANTANARRGPDHRSYNGGLTFNTALGRWMVRCRDGSQVAFARAVVSADLGRTLDESEIVHHKNEDPTDDRLENLVVTDRAGHIRIHMPALLAGRGLS